MNKQWVYKTGGIPDELFIRGKVPMTKSEVRAITIAKARLNDKLVIWDIGAGTGSISVEAALISAGGQVHAVEKEDDAVELIRRNAELFGTDNVSIHHGAAPDALYDLPSPDRVFIGGSGGNFETILKYVHEKLCAGGRVVINAVVLDTLMKAVEMMKYLGFADIDITQVSITKTVDVGRVQMFRSHNPVFIISGQKSN